MIDFSAQIDRAIRVAAYAHEQQGQHRKGTEIPYIVHPIGVMLIAATVTDDEATLIASLFHDVPEDVAPEIYSQEQLSTDFGAEVLGIVLDVTKDETIEDWHERSRGYIQRLWGASEKSLIVAGADKVYNLRDILADYELMGPAVWDKFTTKSGADQLWYYREVSQVLEARLLGSALTIELTRLVGQLAQLIEPESLITAS